MLPIPIESIPKNEAIQEALNFIEVGEQIEENHEWGRSDTRFMYIHKATFQRLCKVLLVGIGELSK